MNAMKTAHDELLGKCAGLEMKILEMEKSELEEKQLFINKASELQNAEQGMKRLEEEMLTLVEKLNAVTKDHKTAIESKAQVEEELRKQSSALSTLQNTVNASNMDQSAMAKELASTTTLCAERLAENNKLQETIKSLEDKVQSMELANTELAGKLNDTEERFNNLIKQNENAVKEVKYFLFCFLWGEGNLLNEFSRHERLGSRRLFSPSPYFLF
ncbi:hypothetical protein COOONC_04376 [Cooperia oncophora]